MMCRPVVGCCWISGPRKFLWYQRPSHYPRRCELYSKHSNDAPRRSSKVIPDLTFLDSKRRHHPSSLASSRGTLGLIAPSGLGFGLLDRSRRVRRLPWGRFKITEATDWFSLFALLIPPCRLCFAFSRALAAFSCFRSNFLALGSHSSTSDWSKVHRSWAEVARWYFCVLSCPWSMIIT